MKIFFDYQIMNAQRFGGVSRYHIELKKYLTQQFNCKVDIVSLLTKNEYLARENNKTIIDFNNVWYLRFVRIVNKIYTLMRVKVIKYDVIHPTWYDSYLINSSKGKLVITIHDMIQELYPVGQEKQIALKKRMIYESDLIIAISQNTKKDILKFYPDIPENKIKVVYHGTNHLPKESTPKGITVPSRYILFVGKRDKYKNGMLFLDAVRELLLEDETLNIIFAGGGAFSQELDEYIKNNINNTNRIILYNASDEELAYLYKNALFFVYPSSYEGFGAPILEAFDNKCPVVCPNISCFPEVAGDAALYFRDNDSKDLKEKMKFLLENEDVRHKLIQLGEYRAKQFTWEKASKETYQAYEELVKNR